MRNATPKEIVFWWVIPCKAISGLFREIAELSYYKVTVVCESGLSEERLKLGWEPPDFGKAKLIILNKINWKKQIDEILMLNKKAIHIYNSIHAYRKISYSIKKAAKLNIEIGVMSESLNNSFEGLKWFSKEIYIRSLLKFKTISIAKKSKFIFCLSGSSFSAKKYLKIIGWSDNKIYPFGYFSEQLNGFDEVNKIDDGKKICLLCTGYLTKNKGHYIMLKAFSIIKKKGLDFVCNITGYGPEEERLKSLTKDLNLDKNVIFTGVVPNNELFLLMKNADIFVAPGLKEPWGIRINEAIQAGLAVVLSNGIGACELVRASGGGEIFKSGDYEELSKALLKLMKNPDKLYETKQLSSNYRKRIHPNTVAKYFDDIIKYCYKEKFEKPEAPWL